MPMPRSEHGTITAKGYRRARWDGRHQFVHVWVWEQANGPIPDGYQIHHIDGDKQNNDLANLTIVTPTEHKRIHSPHYRRAGDGWERRCNVCGEWKPPDVEHYYLSREGWPLYGRCRPCHIARVVAAKQQRRNNLR
jgi:hypothetical protein